MRAGSLAIAVALTLSIIVPASAQFDKPAETGVKLDKPLVQRYKVGMVVRAMGGACRGLYGTVPVPTDWPEQRVKLVEEELSDTVKNVSYRTLDGGVKQMLISIPLLPAGQTAKALVTFEIERSAILAPDNSQTFTAPKKIDLALGKFLGISPYIESRDPKIRALAKEITASKETTWDQVEALYDWVREHVQYRNGPLKGALAALKDGTGDCEELTSLFIALCRAHEIPARTVWVPGHCYPEFYLVDPQGQGHWIPCQAAGTRSFGGIPEQRPILQKGDNFKVPEKSTAQRYVAEFLKGTTTPGGGQPQVEFVRTELPVP